MEIQNLCSSFNEYEENCKDNYVVLKEDVRMRRARTLLKIQSSEL